MNTCLETHVVRVDFRDNNMPEDIFNIDLKPEGYYTLYRCEMPNALA